jgi:predicted ATPase
LPKSFWQLQGAKLELILLPDIVTAMYIHTLKVKNYLSHRDTQISLSPITVLVGPNAGGKSALFDAMLNFSMAARGNIKEAFGPYPFSYNATKYHGSLGFECIGFDLEFSRQVSATERLRYSMEYSQQGTTEARAPSFRIQSERLLLLPENREIFNRSTPHLSHLNKALPYLQADRSIFAALRAAYLGTEVDPGAQLYVDAARDISRINRFRLNPYELAASSRLPDVSAKTNFPPRIGYQGEDLASSLYYLKETNDPTLEVIVDRMRRVAPKFRGLEFNLLGPDRIAFLMVFDDARAEVSAVRVSSGLLLYLGLMVLIYSPNRPPVLLIEEPENGLTPQAISEFYSAVRELALRADENQRSQVLISSHSPFVICEAWNGEDREFIHQVSVVDGHSAVRPFAKAIEESGATLRKGENGRVELGLRTAELVMSGYLSGS